MTVIYGKTSSNVDDLDMLEKVVVPGNDLLRILMDVSVDRDILNGAADMDVEANYHNLIIVFQHVQNFTKISFWNTKL